MRRRTLLGGAIAAATGCSGRRVLVTETGQRRLAARDRQHGVSVVLTTDAWDGQPQNLGLNLTVVHALVANMGTTPILLAPGDLELRDVRGFRYELLDTGASFFRAGEHETPGVGYQRDDPLGYERGRSTSYNELRSPYGDIHSAALPWGALEPGTDMRGFLYFQRVERTVNQARLLWHFSDANRQPMVDFAFDLYVARV